MNLKEQLTEKKQALVDLEPQLKSEDVSAEVVAQGEQLATEISELEKKIATAEKAAEVLKTVGTDDTNKDITEVKKMSNIETFAQKAAEMTDRKNGIVMNFKAATDVVTSPQIADVDRSIAPQPKRVAVADYFSNATISGNAITYFLQGAYEGTPAATAQSAKKPQNSTSFSAVTLALSKIAAYIKETDEILQDASFLASEVQNSLIYRIGVVEDSTVVSAITGTTGVLSEEYDGTTVTFADAILAAILEIKAKSAYDASVVLLNPADLLALMTAKDSNKQYIGGGYFNGAYGNGTYSMPTSIWGVPVFAASGVTAGSAVVAAREAVKIWKKGGIDVKLYEQNEDDAIYNRITLVGEERLACAVVDKNGVCIVSEEES